ncbi:extracellular solute-binding protein [Paenibacillus athensensis]|uniref:Sugar ABC transporter substrate-binding protein n=1 Tax=Paenibacillus athensensis TaxID=1967502 RepID=A0A4Y8PT50_9BACL|nr:extracellular solute-binding protein [Paenibacillus athensensis]MCD1261296.1 extracellular solute-binding protein [Paenibacillus athensensis]
MLKKWSVGLVSVVVAASLAGCGGTSTDSGSSATTSPAATDAPKTDSGKAVTLKVIHWKNEAANKWFDKFNKKFEEKYPNIKIDYTTVPSDDTFKQLQQTRIQANDVDVITNLSALVGAPADWSKGAADPTWKQWIDAGLIADLSDQPFIKNYTPESIKDGGTYNGKVYGITTGSVAFSGLFYNKQIFSDNGLKVPTTWDEFVAVCDALKAKGIAPIGFAGKDIWPINLAVQGLQASVHKDQLSYIKGLWDGSNKFNDAESMDILTKAQKMMGYAVDGFMGVDYGSLPGLFAQGKVAMIADGTWDAPTIAAANPNLKFGYFPIPGSSDAAQNKSLAGKYDMTFMVAEKSKNKEAALQYLSFFSEPANYAEYVNDVGFLPVQPNVDLKSEFIKELTPNMEGFKLAWDQLFINRNNAGEHVAGSSVHAEFLAPAGPIKTVQELADLSQKEWDAAK